MRHFTADELKNVFNKLRNRDSVTEEELEILKMYIPLHLSQERAEEMAKLVEAIREGKRAPLTKDERIEMHKKNMKQSLDNLVASLPGMDDKEFEEALRMCETLRRQMAAD
ncbi:hypothetical protein JOC37_000465 [Desulfohalotomaculum tongense]|uniref:hypothetical protein n=1 Tax=Desulforadius tongensis TaxID=1216062 RepID=UPI00195AA4EC|nr:hypothetical protein [Desulforadius tongensis]MBM7854093.1 hypothetical protein [Desulforadius tongensis]